MTRGLLELRSNNGRLQFSQVALLRKGFGEDGRYYEYSIEANSPTP